MKTRTEVWFARHAHLVKTILDRCKQKEGVLKMRNAALVCFLILIPCSLPAQDKRADWKALYSLRAGEKIELVETGMKKHVGTFSTVTEEAIQMREGSSDIGIPKENVARVTVLDKSHRLRNAFILLTGMEPSSLMSIMPSGKWLSVSGRVQAILLPVGSWAAKYALCAK